LLLFFVEPIDQLSQIHALQSFGIGILVEFIRCGRKCQRRAQRSHGQVRPLRHEHEAAVGWQQDRSLTPRPKAGDSAEQGAFA